MVPKLQPSVLVAALTSETFAEKTEPVQVEFGDTLTLRCRVKKELVGTVYQTDPAMFYFFTPKSKKTTLCETVMTVRQ